MYLIYDQRKINASLLGYFIKLNRKRRRKKSTKRLSVKKNKFEDTIASCCGDVLKLKKKPCYLPTLVILITISFIGTSCFELLIFKEK